MLHAQTMPKISDNLEGQYNVKFSTSSWHGYADKLFDGDTQSPTVTQHTHFYQEGVIKLVFQYNLKIDRIVIWCDGGDEGGTFSVSSHPGQYFCIEQIVSFYPLLFKKIIDFDHPIETCELEFFTKTEDEYNINEIEIYGENLGFPGVEYNFTYDAMGNRTNRIHEIIFDLEELGNCGYEPELKSNKNYQDYSKAFPDNIAHIDLKLYPNPTMGELVIEVLGDKANQPKLTYELLDANGRRVWREKTNEAYFVLDMTEMTTGIYLLRLSYHGEIKTYRIVRK